MSVPQVLGPGSGPTYFLVTLDQSFNLSVPHLYVRNITTSSLLNRL